MLYDFSIAAFDSRVFIMFMYQKNYEISYRYPIRNLSLDRRWLAQFFIGTHS